MEIDCAMYYDHKSEHFYTNLLKNVGLSIMKQHPYAQVEMRCIHMFALDSSSSTIRQVFHNEPVSFNQYLWHPFNTMNVRFTWIVSIKIHTHALIDGTWNDRYATWKLWLLKFENITCFALDQMHCITEFKNQKSTNIH